MRVSRSKTVTLCQHLVKVCAMVFFDPFDDTSKLGVGIGILDIGDGKSNMGIALDILILLTIDSRGEFDIFPIPMKSHR